MQIYITHLVRTNLLCAAEPNRRKCRIWNSHSQVTTLPKAAPNAQFMVVRFFTLCCGWTIHPTAKMSEEVNRTCPPRNMMLQLWAPSKQWCLAPQYTSLQTERQTDGQTDYANSWSYRLTLHAVLWSAKI